MKKIRAIKIAAFIAALTTGIAAADYVTIGNLGNTVNPLNGYGRVDYSYRISQYEVTIAEFMASGAGNGNENYWNDGIRQIGPNSPATKITLYEAMRYCNWLTTGDVNNGLYEDKGNGVWGAKMDRAAVMAGNTLYYALPTLDEWYKAAFYTGNPDNLWSLYSDGTDTAPLVSQGRVNFGNHLGHTWSISSGQQEQNGTYNMMGNVWEWIESSPDNQIFAGCGYSDHSLDRRFLTYGPDYDESTEHADIGFRVVAIPEPAAVGLICIGGCITLLASRLKQRI